MTFFPLVIADYRADRIYALHEAKIHPLGSGTPAEHAGILQLPTPMESSSRWAYVDDRRGNLVIQESNLRSPDTLESATMSAAIPGEHIACDPSGRYVVVTTGLGMNAEPWSDIVTVIDTATRESVRFRSRTGEPGVAILPDQANGELMIVLRHREPGAIESIPLTTALAVGAHVPQLSGQLTEDVADDGHGDVIDPHHGIFATATSNGLECFHVEHGYPRPMRTIPWPVDGRAFYLRFDALTMRAVGVVRGGPSSPQSWTSWRNYLVDAQLHTGDIRHTALPDGLAFRFASGGGTTAVASIHPEGDQLTVLHRDNSLFDVAQTIPLPSMTHPPIPGHLPWDSVGDSPAQRRAVAVDPSGQHIAVTRGGDAELHLFSDASSRIFQLPTPLNEGGLLYWNSNGNDLVGR